MASESSNRTSNGFLTFVGVAVVLVAVTVVAVGALAITGLGGETLEQKRAALRIEVRTRLEKEAQDKLTSEGWVDKAKGLVHVSITDAIPLAVAELRSKKPAPSQIKVEPSLPVFVPDPKSTEPPPPALPSAPQGADLIRFTPPSTPAPAAGAPAPVPAPAKPAAPPAPAPVPAPVPPPPAPESKPAPPPAAPAPEAPARPPLINPTENPAPTK